MATKKPTRKAAKKGTKTYSTKAKAGANVRRKISAGKSEDPIIIGGGSVRIKFNNKPGKFKNNGNGNHKHPTATLVSILVNGALVRNLNPTDVITINLA